MDPVIVSIASCWQPSTQTVRALSVAGGQAAPQASTASASLLQPGNGGTETPDPKTQSLAIAEAAALPDDETPFLSL